MAGVEIVEIDAALLPAVSQFLERSIDRRISAADFSAALGRRWAGGPMGVALMANGAVVGAIGTIRSTRIVHADRREFCNLTSFALDPEFRSLAPALLRRATEKPHVVYTNFTASRTVVELLRAFGFVDLDPRERILIPRPSARRRDGSVVTGIDAVERLLARGRPEIAPLVVDHRGTRVEWIGIEREGECGVFALHLMRARGLPLAHVLYASPSEQFADFAPIAARACHQPFGFRMLAWPAWQFPSAGWSIPVRRPTPVLIKGEAIAPSDIDGLYSELTTLPILA